MFIALVVRMKSSDEGLVALNDLLLAEAINDGEASIGFKYFALPVRCYVLITQVRRRRIVYWRHQGLATS
jgi:hypothetical protein